MRDGSSPVASPEPPTSLLLDLRDDVGVHGEGTEV